MKNENTVRSHGWGADREFSVRPGVPMEKPSKVQSLRGKRPTQQHTEVRILKSTEYPDVTPVFGTTCPPRGLSGLMRRAAYARYSEGQLRHWFLLMAADRVDVVEGYLEDFAHLRLPNIVRERGWTAELKYADTARKRKLALGAALSAGALGAVLLFVLRGDRKAHD